MPARAVSSSTRAKAPGAAGDRAAWLEPARRLLAALEAPCDRAFGSLGNPWHQLGALSFFFFWIIAATGIYLYAFFDTSVAGAYPSVERLTREQWFFGGIIRSLHRYASDAFVVSMALHLLREFVQGHWHGFRWFSWLTGVPLLWLAFASGIGGFWLVWDELAQFSLIASAEWFDGLPLLSQPIVRNFLEPAAINDRFFSLLIFLHIGFPLALLLGMWVHIYRLSHARTNPPRALALGTFAALVLLALIKPVTSLGSADLDRVAQALPLDWFYLFVHPWMYATSPGAIWLASGLATLLLCLAPLLPHPRREPAAVVDLAHCNGCSRCFDDCPYVAITMVPRRDGSSHTLQAEVDPALCAGCGICAGACPSATPFRTQTQIRTGIDLPRLTVDALRAKLEAALEALEASPRVVVFGCDQAVEVQPLGDARTAVLSLRCAGMLPPSFIDYALKNGADGVLITACAEGDCAFRLGQAWLAERLTGRREPHLRAAVDPRRVRYQGHSAREFATVKQELASLREELRAIGVEDQDERREINWKQRRKTGDRNEQA